MPTSENELSQFENPSLIGEINNFLAQNGQNLQEQLLIERLQNARGYGAVINEQDARQRTPLYISIKHLLEDTANYLLQNGADPKIANDQGDTPLHAAAGMCYQDMAIRLINTGHVDINARNQAGSTPLHAAIQYDNFEADSEAHIVSMVNTLLDNGANINEENEEGLTPLHSAVLSGRVAVISLLLQRGADVNKVNSDGDTPLNLLCWDTKHSEDLSIVIAQRLIEFGAKIDEPNNQGRDAIYLATFTKQEGLKNYLETMYQAQRALEERQQHRQKRVAAQGESQESKRQKMDASIPEEPSHAERLLKRSNTPFTPKTPGV